MTVQVFKRLFQTILHSYVIISHVKLLEMTNMLLKPKMKKHK